MTTEIIWGNFKNKLLNYVRSRVKDQNLAEDILQDVFVKIHTHIDEVAKKERLDSWLYRITRNAIIDHYRKKNIVLFQENPKDVITEPPVKVERDFTKCLGSFLNELAPKDKEVLSKTVFGNLSQKDYAEQNKLSYSAAKSRTQRARKKLKDLFVACCSIQADVYGNIIASKEEECSCGC